MTEKGTNHFPAQAERPVFGSVNGPSLGARQ
jgi:hypothetical protein